MGSMICMIYKMNQTGSYCFLKKMSNKFAGNSAGRHGRVTWCVSCNNSANLMESFLKSIATPWQMWCFFHVTLTKRCSTWSPGFPCQFCLALMKLISEGNLLFLLSRGEVFSPMCRIFVRHRGLERKPFNQKYQSMRLYSSTLSPQNHYWHQNPGWLLQL